MLSAGAKADSARFHALSRLTPGIVQLPANVGGATGASLGASLGTSPGPGSDNINRPKGITPPLAVSPVPGSNVLTPGALPKACYLEACCVAWEGTSCQAVSRNEVSSILYSMHHDLPVYGQGCDVTPTQGSS